MQKLNKTLLYENIDRIAQYDFSKNKVFGSAYYVYQEDSLDFEKCYGRISLNSDTPVTKHTLFRLASMTKPITAVATLILVEQGRLSLEDPVDKFLPNFKSISVVDSLGNRFKPINMPTVRNILSHCAGIGSNYSKLDDMTAKDRETIDASIAYYINKGLDYEPGTAQMYSATGAFDVLVKIIEIVTGTAFPDFLQEVIFEPCKMENTTFAPTAQQKENMIKMHQLLDGENAEFEMPEGCVFESFPYAHYLGGAGLASTLSDYCNFAKMLLNKGSIDGKQIISEETFNQLCTPQVSKDIMNNDYLWGLGVRVISDDSYPYLPVGTYGWSGAYGSHFWIDPENRIFAVYMKNSKFDGGAANESGKNFEKAVYSALE